MCSFTWTRFVPQQIGGGDALMCCLKPYGLLSITDTSPATLLNALRMLHFIFAMRFVPPK